MNGSKLLACMSGLKLQYIHQHMSCNAHTHGIPPDIIPAAANAKVSWLPVLPKACRRNTSWQNLAVIDCALVSCLYANGWTAASCPSEG